PGPARNLTLLSRNATVAQLSWFAPTRENGIIKGYELYYTEGGEAGATWKTPVSKFDDQIFFYLTSLKPGTNYLIYVRAINGAGLGGPSNLIRITTMEVPPDPPENLKADSVDFAKVELSWNPPTRPNGRLLKYLIVYKEEGKKKRTNEMVADGGKMAVNYTLSGLKTGTHYKIHVKAENIMGTSHSSNQVIVVTSKPNPVGNLFNISRSSTSFKLRWTLPESGGDMMESILVQCDLSRSLTSPPGQKPVRIKLDPNTVEVLVRNLSPASLYVCSVKNNYHALGVVREAHIKVWTMPAELKPPRSPQVIGYTDNSATLKLFESDDRTIDFYRIVVESVGRRDTNRRRRDLYENDATHPDVVRLPRAAMRVQDMTHDIHTARANGETAYVTAEFEPHRLRGTFTVGDKKTYNGYYNGPLKKELQYTFWLVAYSNVDGIQQSQLVKVDKPLEARSTGAAPTSNSITVMVGVIAVFILLILIFAVLLILWRRHHIAEDREKAEMPSFGPAILPEPETPEPSTPLGKEDEVEQLIDVPSTELLVEAEPVYTNTDDVYPPIKVEDLWDYIRSAKQNDLDGLKKEFKLLPAGVTAPCEVARRNENKYKNRYGNIIAYDHSRVLLDPEGDDKTDDYINANYIDGYKKQRVYIAAQGPSKPTLNDIWRMAWKENSKTIIMLTNVTESGKKKCEVYWPETGSEQYGNISVQLLETDVLPDFTIRTFLMSKGGQSKYIKQFHYTTWPDHGVPRFGHSLLLFRQKIRAYDLLDSGTVIIHCSAGVGRTGTYISVDTQLEMAKSEGLIDVFNFVHHMRSQRVNMVQTLEQYVFVYDCLLEALICGDTTVTSYAFPELYTELCLFDQDISKTKLEEQFEILKLLSTTIERDESTSALSQENIFKNRCKNIVPANRCRPYLMTACEGGNDYINAVYLNSYVKRDQLLVTQMPLPDTVTDFWRLVYDHKSHCIVMLNEVETNDDVSGQTCEQYWTEDPGGITYGPFHVETTSEIKSNPIVTVRDFTLTNTEKEEGEPSRLVRQFHFHRWQEGSVTPSSHRALLELVDMLQAWTQQQEGPVVLHCMNGASRCGVVCATLTILERLQKEKEVDIFQAVKQLRLNRPQLVDNMEQYQFCHELVLDYLSNDQEASGSVS
ncbi:receptor-type tyrosine-protein phosphatase t, partial [Plakobranchus ocellatus]